MLRSEFLYLTATWATCSIRHPAHPPFFSFFFFFLSRKILQQLSDLWCLRSVSMDIISSRFSSISTASWPSMINSPLQVYITDKRMPCMHFKENSEKKGVFLLSYATDFKSYLLPPCLFIAKPLILLCLPSILVFLLMLIATVQVTQFITPIHNTSQAISLVHKT